MRYIPHTPEDVRRMLDAVGVETVEDLFDLIPDDLRLGRALDLPEGLPECLLMEHMEDLAGRNRHVGTVASFLGGGIYDHYTPQVVDQLLLRSEFYTAYTPYQPEIAQGTLQAIFEYQTLVCQLFGMEVANASLYDGGSALAEAVLMAGRTVRRQKVLIARSVHPEYRQIVRTYTQHLDWEVVEIPFGADGRVDPDAVRNELDERTSAVVVQSPNYFGVVEDLAPIADAAHEHGALSIVAFSEPLAYALLKAPGDCGADIVCGEGQSFGLPIAYGGPHVGMFATRSKYVRNMPGRLCGRTVDADGNRGFVLTLSTREQHIRREKATSNICTNQALCALGVTIYLSLLGKVGLRKLAQVNLDRAQYLLSRLTGVKGVAPAFSGKTFNEFVVRTDSPAAEFLASLPDDVRGGIDLAADYPELGNAVLVTVTETNRKEDINRYVAAAER